MYKLFGKIGNIEDIVQSPNSVPTGIISEGHYPGGFKPLDFGKPCSGYAKIDNLDKNGFSSLSRYSLINLFSIQRMPGHL